MYYVDFGENVAFVLTSVLLCQYGIVGNYG